jgi:hypothetical protein
MRPAGRTVGAAVEYRILHYRVREVGQRNRGGPAVRILDPEEALNVRLTGIRLSTRGTVEEDLSIVPFRIVDAGDPVEELVLGAIGKKQRPGDLALPRLDIRVVVDSCRRHKRLRRSVHGHEQSSTRVALARGSGVAVWGWLGRAAVLLVYELGFCAVRLQEHHLGERVAAVIAGTIIGASESRRGDGPGDHVARLEGFDGHVRLRGQVGIDHVRRLHRDGERLGVLPRHRDLFDTPPALHGNLHTVAGRAAPLDVADGDHEVHFSTIQFNGFQVRERVGPRRRSRSYGGRRRAG